MTLQHDCLHHHSSIFLLTKESNDIVGDQRPQNEMNLKDDNEDRRERILRHVVAAEGRPLRPLDIARSLSLDKSAVNRGLYELHYLNRVQRTGTSPPFWRSCETRNASSFDDKETDASLVEKIMLGTKMEGTSSASLAYSMKVDTIVVNRILYTLEKKRRVERVQMSPPVWRIVSGGAISLPTSPVDHRLCKEGTESDKDALPTPPLPTPSFNLYPKSLQLVKRSTKRIPKQQLQPRIIHGLLHAKI